VTGRASRWMMLIPLALVAGLAACGGSSTNPTASTSSSAAATPTVAAPTPTASTAAATCPSGATVGSALGITLPNAVVVPNTGATQFPSGATGISCEYRATTDNVIITVLQNIPASYISKFSDKFPVTFKPVSGVGDEARTFFQSLGAGRNNQGVVAAKGTTVVAIVATYTPATLSQLEALVNSLL
jgi:hypothetical protein